MQLAILRPKFSVEKPIEWRDLQCWGQGHSWMLHSVFRGCHIMTMMSWWRSHLLATSKEESANVMSNWHHAIWKWNGCLQRKMWMKSLDNQWQQDRRVKQLDVWNKTTLDEDRNGCGYLFHWWNCTLSIGCWGDSNHQLYHQQLGARRGNWIWQSCHIEICWELWIRWWYQEGMLERNKMERSIVAGKTNTNTIIFKLWNLEAGLVDYIAGNHLVQTWTARRSNVIFAAKTQIIGNKWTCAMISTGSMDFAETDQKGAARRWLWQELRHKLCH